MVRLAAKRNQQGCLAALMLAVLLLFIVGLGCLSADIGHNVTVRSQLQDAADAAALSGAQDLISPMTQRNSDSDALATASQNYADGRSVSNLSAATLVNSQSQMPQPAQAGLCQVDAQMTIANVWSCLFGHASDQVNATSSAAAYTSITGVDQGYLFPLAVSIDTSNGHTQPLYQSQVGDQVTFYINSQQYKNAAYTGLTTGQTNANYINAAIDMALGLIPAQPGFIPAVNIGDSIGLMNGIAGTKSLASGQEYTALLNENTIYLPLISGDPPYNQTGNVVGFIGVHVNQVIVDQCHGQVEELVATITKTAVKGVPGPVGNPTGNAAVDAGIQNLSPGMVMLTNTQLNDGIALAP